MNTILFFVILSLSVIHQASGDAPPGFDGMGSAGNDDEDDPNMVGQKKQASRKGNSNNNDILAGLEQGLKDGGVQQLVGMLSAMHATHVADPHIKKGPDGEDMYDYRDLDQGSTTAEPMMALGGGTTPGPNTTKQTTMEPLTLRPFSMPPAAAIAVASKASSLRDPPPSHRVAPSTGSSKPTKLVVWPPSQTPAAIEAPSHPLASHLPASGQGVRASEPTVPMALVAAGSSLQEGLETVRQNLDMLISQAGSAPLAARIDNLAQTFNAEEESLEQRLSQQAKELKSLEAENMVIKRQLDKQAQEMEAAGPHAVVNLPAHHVKTPNVTRHDIGISHHNANMHETKTPAEQKTNTKRQLRGAARKVKDVLPPNVAPTSLPATSQGASEAVSAPEQADGVASAGQQGPEAPAPVQAAAEYAPPHIDPADDATDSGQPAQEESADSDDDSD